MKTVRLAGLLTLTLTAFAACDDGVITDPDIGPGAYHCGREQLCPAGQVCNGPDQTCVLAGQQQPFSCGSPTEHEPNDTQIAAEVVPDLLCVSAFVEVIGCSSAEVDEDWFQIDVPGSCTSVAIAARPS